MEITIIHGQMHKGSTYHITEMLKSRLARQNTVVHEFYLPKDGPSYCVGCFRCIMKGEEFCPETDEVQKIAKAMLTSQVIIVDSPTYCFEMTGQLKTLFDHFAYLWMSHRPREEMFSKIGVVVSTAAGAGAKNVTKSIRRQFFWWGIPKTYRLNFNVNASAWEAVEEKMKRKIDLEIEEISVKIRSESGKIKAGIKTKLIFSVMRRMQGSNSWNRADKDHWENNRWLGKARPWNQ